jgi:translation initiation factor IF-1
MAREDAIEIEAMVVELLPNTMFPVALPNGRRFWPIYQGKCGFISFVSCQATKLC